MKNFTIFAMIRRYSLNSRRLNCKANSIYEGSIILFSNCFRQGSSLTLLNLVSNWAFLISLKGESPLADLDNPLFGFFAEIKCEGRNSFIKLFNRCLWVKETRYVENEFPIQRKSGQKLFEPALFQDLHSGRNWVLCLKARTAFN